MTEKTGTVTTPQFDHLGLTCREPLATEHFYVTHFGFRRERSLRLGEREIIFLRHGGLTRELFPAGAPAPAPFPEADGPNYPGFRHLAFRVADLDATLAAIGPAAALTLGPLELGEQPGKWRVAWIRDPDGRIVELAGGGPE